MSFGSVKIYAEEGDTVQVCTTLEGTGWLFLERDITIVLDSDGGKHLCSSQRKGNVNTRVSKKNFSDFHHEICFL